jgi:hypothetical protein
MYRSGFGMLVLLVACGGSAFAPDTGSSSGGGGGASGSGDTTGNGGVGTSNVATNGVTTGSTTSAGMGGGSAAGGSGGASTVAASTVAASTAAASTVATGGAAGNGGGGGGGTGIDAGSQDAGGVNCSALASEIGQKLLAAQACNPNDAAPGQCQDIVDGLCCHVPVANKDSQQTRAYLAALAKYRDANCPIGCTAVPCSMAAPVCKAGPDGNAFFCQRLAGG